MVATTFLPCGFKKYEELLEKTGKQGQIDRAQCFEVSGDYVYIFNWRTETWWFWNLGDRDHLPRELA